MIDEIRADGSREPFRFAFDRRTGELCIADISHELAFYHDRPREMREVEDERLAAFATFEQSVDRPERVDSDDS